MPSDYAAFALSKVEGTTCNGYTIDTCKAAMSGFIVLAHKGKIYAVIVSLCAMDGASLYVVGTKNNARAYYTHIAATLD
jgi:hypothetical protein